MTQKECMNLIKKMFIKNIVRNEKDFLDYDYANKKCIDHLREFLQELKRNGFSTTKTYHACGIGNNNQKYIYLEERDADGFIIEKRIADLSYTYGVYGGCCCTLTDLVSKNRWQTGRAI